MKAADRIAADLERVLWAWVLLLIVGALSVAAGVIVLAKPHISLAALAVVFGIFLLIDGVLELSWALVRRGESRALPALVGVVSAVAGVVLIRHPTKAVAVIALLLGLWLIVLGLIRLIPAFDQAGHRGWAIFSGLVEIAGGIVIVSSPHIGVATLALLVGIVFIVRGLAIFVVAWALHRASRSAGAPAGGSAPAT
jgi:uncharacterized membrane protein HdeD (DUF308 family)